MDISSSQDAQPLENGEQVEPHYEGEDTRLTSRKELSGWYCYGFAAEVFAICAMGTCPCSLPGWSTKVLHEMFLDIQFTVPGAAPATPIAHGDSLYSSNIY
jgi:hypothetical protein